jgi:hypothetical protein
MANVDILVKVIGVLNGEAKPRKFIKAVSFAERYRHSMRDSDDCEFEIESMMAIVQRTIDNMVEEMRKPTGLQVLKLATIYSVHVNTPQSDYMPPVARPVAKRSHPTSCELPSRRVCREE